MLDFDMGEEDVQPMVSMCVSGSEVYYRKEV